MFQYMHLYAGDESFMEKLDALGNEGWEAVGFGDVCVPVNASCWRTATHLLLKRKVENHPERIWPMKPIASASTPATPSPRG